MALNISPIPAGGIPSVNPNEGRSASQERLARAKAISMGQEPAQDMAPTGDAQADRTQSVLKKIKMRTQVSPNRHESLERAIAAATEAPGTEAEVEPAAQSDIVDTSVEAGETSEETKPVSPQFAALARQKRALQLKEREIATREAALANKPADSAGYTKEQIKANALRVLRESGVTNDELTQALINETSDYGPGYTRLESEIKALKEGLENQSKVLTEREQAQENQVLAQMRAEADQLSASGDDYEFIRDAGLQPNIIKWIHKHWQKTGEVKDVSEVMATVETALVENAINAANRAKVKSRLTPAQVEQAKQAVSQDSGNRKIMKTLTNRDGSSSISMTKRERAIAAMEGRLK